MSRIRRGALGSLFSWVIGLTGVVSAMAQEGDGLVTQSTSLTWRQVLQSGGIPMYAIAGALLAMSIMTVALVIYFAVVLRPSQVAPLSLGRAVIDSLRQGQIDAARKSCEHRPCPLSAVALSAMDYMRDVPDVDPSLMKDIMEGEGARQSESIQGQTHYLMDIAVISPMLGLLGTVYGMIQAFGGMATDIASAKPIVLAEGVSQALLTTAWGLIVGIPAMILYSVYRRRCSQIVSYLESAATEILIALQIRRDR